jgi:hypothetical protein
MQYGIFYFEYMFIQKCMLRNLMIDARRIVLTGKRWRQRANNREEQPSVIQSAKVFGKLEISRICSGTPPSIFLNVQSSVI